MSSICASESCGKADIILPLYSLKIAIASLSPEALKAALFLIQDFNQSFSLLSVTPARAGPTSFLSNL